MKQKKMRLNKKKKRLRMKLNNLNGFTLANSERIWLISDTHFNHANIIKHCDRPFNSMEEMNKTMIDNWNAVVGKNDLIIHLGDFAFRDARSFLPKLNGIILLVLGNHDNTETRNSGILYTDILEMGNIILTHRPIPIEERKQGKIYLHGHSHNKEKDNVCVENTDYKPIRLLDAIKQKMERNNGKS